MKICKVERFWQKIKQETLSKCQSKSEPIQENRYGSDQPCPYNDHRTAISPFIDELTTT